MSGQNLLSNAMLFELSPLHVDEGVRIGFLHEDKAAALGRLMAVDGQRDPIKVVAQPENADQPWRLVTGMHRLIGARLEGLTVFAIEVSGAPEDLADLEASENLHRRPLAPLERAKFTAALVIAAQERLAREHGNLKQQQMAIKARWDRVRHGDERVEEALRAETEDTSATMAHVYGWEESVGEALDMSRRTIHRDLTLYRLLIEPFPDLVRELAAHPVVGENAAQLKVLAAIKDDAKRRKAIAFLLQQPEASADEASAQAGVAASAAPAPTKDVKFTNTISDSWTRLSLGAKRDYLPRFVGLLTADMKVQLRRLLDGELGE